VNVLLLTGAPGVGKTTVLRKVAGFLPGKVLGGFYTDEIRVGGSRRGFRIVTFDGRERVMARVNLRSPHRAGRYGVDIEAIDAVAATELTIRPSIDVFLVDEIGKMECLSSSFIAAMRVILGSGKPLVATVALRGTGFIAEIKRRQGVEIWPVTRERRDALPDEVVHWLEKTRTLQS
jgi:nucleoside-triphosphatase